MVPWANGKNAKEYRATLGNKAIGGIFNVGIVSPYRWLNSTKSAAETRLWVQDGVANGLRPWSIMVSGQPHDRRGLEDWHGRSLRLASQAGALALRYHGAESGAHWPDVLAADGAGFMPVSDASRKAEDPGAGYVPGA